jgi:membrane-bound ClpP family serine protease
MSTNFMLVLGVALIGMGIILFILEQFVPASGLLGVCAAVSFVAGIVLVFQVDTRLGLISAIVVVALIPVMLIIGLYYWPQSPMAQFLMLRGKEPGLYAQQGVAGGDAAADRAHLVGLHGEALTDLKPGGFCKIDGKRIECLSDGAFIPAGSTIRVTAVDGMQTKVRET